MNKDIFQTDHSIMKDVSYCSWQPMLRYGKDERRNFGCKFFHIWERVLSSIEMKQWCPRQPLCHPSSQQNTWKLQTDKQYCWQRTWSKCTLHMLKLIKSKGSKQG